MKRLFFPVVLFLALLGCTSSGNPEGEAPVATTVSSEANSEEMPDKLLRHVVLFKFKDGTAPEDIEKVEEAFSALPAKIPEIYSYEWGTNNSPEGLADGFTHCFFLSFKSEEDRAVYLPHPDHKAFGEVLGPHLDKVLVVDYWNDGE